MWATPRYTFEGEFYDSHGELTTMPFCIDVTYSTPRNLDDPGKALSTVFSKITAGMDPEKTRVLDVGAGKLRNTCWFLQKGFHVWAVEFPELRDRLPDAAMKWTAAEEWENFHKVMFPRDFLSLTKTFDIILLINVINVMPIPRERYALLSLCRDRIKGNGQLLWQQWRAKAIHPESYTDENAFLDGYRMGPGPNHSFYVEQSRDESHEMMFASGFAFDESMALHRIPSNSGHSFIFRPQHLSLIPNALDVAGLVNTDYDPKNVISNVSQVDSLDLYFDELSDLPVGRKHARQYHLLAARILYQLFKEELRAPLVEFEVNEGRGRIDLVYGIHNKEGIFRNLRDLWRIHCPQLIVECKNYAHSLTNTEYDQLAGRLTRDRGLLGFLLCRDKKDHGQVIKHCQDRHKHASDMYIIVLDDKDLEKLNEYRAMRDDGNDPVMSFIEKRVREILN
jgi:hypothetical protein